MVSLLVLGEGVKRGLGEYILEVIEIVQYSILEGPWLHIPAKGLCQMLQHGLTDTDLHGA